MTSAAVFTACWASTPIGPFAPVRGNSAPMTISFGAWAKAGRIPNASAAVPAVNNSLRFMVVLLLRGTSAAAPAPLLLATQGSRGRPIDLALSWSVIADALAR